MVKPSSNIEYFEVEPRFKKADPPPSYPAYLPIIQVFFKIFGTLLPGYAANFAYYLFTKPRLRAKHRNSDKILESAEIFEFLYGKEILKGYQWGSGEKVILLVHGWESRGTALRSFVPPLLARGYKVVAFDGPAHGNSGGKRTSLPVFAGAVKALIHRLGGIYGAITHSFGGAALVFAMKRLAPDVHLKKMVLIAVPAEMEHIFSEVVDVLQLPKRAAAKLRLKMENLANDSLENVSLPNAGKDIRVDEVLVVHDTEDGVVPFRFAERIAATWPNAHLLAPTGLGHFRILKHLPIIERIDDFLDLDQELISRR